MTIAETRQAPRTAAATAARAYGAQRVRADYLRARGWTCFEPGQLKDLAVLLSVVAEAARIEDAA